MMPTTEPQHGRPPTQVQDWGDERLADTIASLCGSEELDHWLHSCQRQLSPSVIRLLKDKVAYLVRADIHRAAKLADATRAAAALIADPGSEALALHACAQALHIAGRHTEALDFYERAEAIYARLGKPVEAARIGRAKAGVLMVLGEYESALRVAAHACQVFRQHHQSILLAQTQENIGSIYHRMDQYREALTYYEQARKMYQAHQYEFGLASVSFNAAIQYTNLNQFERAGLLYQQALEIYRKLDMPLLVNQTEYSIAWLYSEQGEFQESLKLFTRVSARSRELGDTVQQAFCQLDLAEVYLRLNAYEDAIESARAAVAEFRALEMRYELAKAQMYLGVAHTHLGHFPAAEQELQQARRGFSAESNEVFMAVTDIYLSEVFRHRRDWQRALHLCTEAGRIFDRHRLSSKAVYAELQLARLKFLLGQADQAQALCQSALTAIGESEAPWLKYQCFHLLGNTMEQAGELAAAYDCYRRAVAHLERLRITIPVDEFKCTFLRDKLRLYEDLVELCLRAGTKKKAEEALATVEAAKSRALVDRLTIDHRVGSKADRASTSALVRRLRKLRRELNWYTNRLNECETQGAQTASLREAIGQRERQLARIIRQMWIEDAEYSSLQSVSRPDIAQLRSCLSQDEVLVEYYIVGGRVKVFLLDRESIRVFNDIATLETLTPLLEQLRFGFDKFTLGQHFVEAHLNTVWAFTHWCLKELYRALVEPILPLLDQRKLVIVPHGLLHYVPFHALYDGRQYLIDRHEISYCPSASVFTLCSEKARTPPATDQMLIMGVPDEATPFINEEVIAVKSLWPNAHVFMGQEATMDRLKQQASGVRFLHLASHAVFRRDNPMFSALRLGDAWLSFYDIFNLNLKAELVTLSACETGMNDVSAGDELFGLMRGFLYAGAPSLTVSLWLVNDGSTAQFMRHFYRGLQQGRDKRAALRRAQMEVRRTHQHPYYWAPFILMGAPN